MACTGTNTQKLINLLETIFGNQDEPDLEGLELGTMQEMWEEVATAKKDDLVATESPIPSRGITHMVVTSLPVLFEFGLQPEMCPETEFRLARKILPKGSLNSIMHATGAHTHLRTNQACTPTPDNVLTLN